jgi:hypothetical protein
MRTRSEFTFVISTVKKQTIKTALFVISITRDITWTKYLHEILHFNPDNRPINETFRTCRFFDPKSSINDAFTSLFRRTRLIFHNLRSLRGRHLACCGPAFRAKTQHPSLHPGNRALYPNMVTHRKPTTWVSRITLSPLHRLLEVRICF